MRVRKVVTTRAGGRSSGAFTSFNLSRGVGDDPSAVASNRGRLVRELGLSGAVFLQQVHGIRVETVSGPAPGAGVPDLAEADAVVTAEPGVGLAVLAADCVPVLLSDPKAGVVGAAHAGRVGAAAGVVPATLQAMVALGADVEDVVVLLGPAVCGGCYEVPAEMRDEVGAVLPGSGGRTRRGTPGIDIRAGLHRQLDMFGVRGVARDPRCTMEDPALFSHRREGSTGRQAGVVWLDPSDG
ncbi:peptidoglycan editing factor PgeF [Pseudonocardia sp. N23]|uniref:peptidoglycan editing factor PgeF n=1 Tax=Pseudonocardia sp. N23 TaxID=1987376 RepID=UPI000BFD123E|nr:peptidoglycan editing factor PgeF [Pseudonocardia sp. N23]GAY10633.1 uncharacterized conserved protein [Pseudonocardia sp. N23]